MEKIEAFADGGVTSGDIRWEPYLERRIMEYIESNSVLREFCFVYPMPINTFTVRIPRNYATGLAVEVAEGSEIPVVRQVTDSFDLTVTKYGTGGEMTDEAKETDWLGILGQAQIDEAAKRMLRKENADIMTVLLAGIGSSQSATTAGTLKVEDIVLCKTELIKRFYNPDILIVNPDQYADLQVDERFIDASRSGSTQTLREGVVGRVSGLDLVILPEMPSGTAVMMDSSVNPLWLVERQGARSAQYRNERRQVSGFVTYRWAKPAMVRGAATRKITNC
jgi:N4-gp56 family major capsid protein